MKIHYINRAEYLLKESSLFLEKIYSKFGDFYLIPEGGTNSLAIKGTSEILDKNDIYEYICCPVGTGGTMAGLVNSINKNQKVIGFPAIKDGGGLKKTILNWTYKDNFNLINDYHFGGYAKINNKLIDFIQDFYSTQNIPLDAIYTGKMMFAIMDLTAKDYFPSGSSILAVHTGGLQGNRGINERFGLKLPVNN